MILRTVSVIALFTATLVACGGGSSSGTTPTTPAATADAIDKFVGVWVNCAATGTNTSSKTTLTFAKTSAASGSYTVQDQSYSASTVCAGTNTTSSQTGTITHAGTKIVGADTVDKLDLATKTPVASNDKDIALISGTTLKLGDSTTLDASGYPTALDAAVPFTKQ
jgi:hypothetical protein